MSDFRATIWPELAGILDTTPALAAMSTIMRARAENDTAPVPPQIEDPAGFAARVYVDLANDGVLTTAQRSEFIASVVRGLAKLTARARPFRAGDRVLFGVDDTPGRVVKATGVTTGFAVQVEFSEVPRGLPDDTNVHWVSPTELKLANENVAVETARAGLALLAASAVGEGFERPFDHAVASMRDAWVPTFERLFATDEAQRLIRLHG